MPTDQTDREADIAKLRDAYAEETALQRNKKAVADAFVDECKGSGLDPITGTTEEDREAFKRIDAAFKDADRHAERAAEFKGRLERLVGVEAREADALAQGDMSHPAAKRALGLAERFMASQPYQQLRKSGALEMTEAQVRTAPVTVASRELLMQALFPTYAASLDIDALIPTDSRLIPPVPVPQRQLQIRDLVNVATTDTDTVEWVEEVTVTHAAAETSYGQSAPESTYEYEARSAAVKRIPHHVKATKGNLADQGQLRSLLDSRLIYGAGKRLDGQMVNGNGTGQNIRGILETVGLQQVDGDYGTGDGAENVPDAFHMGLTAVRLSLEDEPTAFGIHPSVYEQFALAKATDGHYLNLRGVDLAAPANIWGKPAVVSTAFPSSGALVGDWKRGATLWVRSGVSVAVTDSDSDDFLKGIVTILAELRAAFAVVEPRAFAEIINIGET